MAGDYEEEEEEDLDGIDGDYDELDEELAGLNGEDEAIIDMM